MSLLDKCFQEEQRRESGCRYDITQQTAGGCPNSCAAGISFFQWISRYDASY